MVVEESVRGGKEPWKVDEDGYLCNIPFVLPSEHPLMYTTPGTVTKTLGGEQEAATTMATSTATKIVIVQFATSKAHPSVECEGSTFGHQTRGITETDWSSFCPRAERYLCARAWKFYCPGSSRLPAAIMLINNKQRDLLSGVNLSTDNSAQSDSSRHINDRCPLPADVHEGTAGLKFPC